MTTTPPYSLPLRVRKIGESYRRQRLVQGLRYTHHCAIGHRLGFGRQEGVGFATIGSSWIAPSWSMMKRQSKAPRRKVRRVRS
jgi:hypothetical protein